MRTVDIIKTNLHDFCLRGEFLSDPFKPFRQQRFLCFIDHIDYFLYTILNIML